MTIGIPEIVGGVSAVGLGVLGLIRAGLLNLKIGRNNPKLQPSTGTLILDRKHGESHTKIDETLKALGDTQIRQEMLIEQHGKDLKRGEEKFDTIITEIGKINTNVGILLDRTK